MNSNVPVPASYHDVIARAAADPAFDVEKLERLIALQEASENRVADRQFNVALADAQAELRQVKADASNPQTHSKYASYAALDREVRPVYTRHGFAVSFSTEPTVDPNTIMVVGMLSNGSIARRHQISIPIDTKGARGQDMMTRTHATMSAATYGKRGLLAMMFNLAVGDDYTDDDGNKAGGKIKRARDNQPPPAPVAPVPPGHQGGNYVTPFVIDWLDADTPRAWGEKLIACLRSYCRSSSDVEEFIGKNTNYLERIQREAPTTYKLLQSSIDAARKTFD